MTTRRTTAAAVLTAAALATGAAGVLAGPAGAATTTTTTSPTARCVATPWEGAVQGTPHVVSGDRGGDYLWHDSHGFHLRVTHGSNHDRRVFSGEIVSSARLHVAPVRLEKGDVLRLSGNRRAIVFVFTNHGYIDGVNFTTDCARSVTVKDLHVGNHNQARTEVYLGAKKAHPKAIPFTVHRRPTTTT